MELRLKIRSRWTLMSHLGASTLSIAALSLSVFLSPTAASLIATGGKSNGFLPSSCRAFSRAVNLATVAPSADSDLLFAASAQEESIWHGSYLHLRNQSGDVSELLHREVGGGEQTGGVSDYTAASVSPSTTEADGGVRFKLNLGGVAGGVRLRRRDCAGLGRR